MCKEHCGGAHPAYECRKKSEAVRKPRLAKTGTSVVNGSPDKSTAARKDVPMTAVKAPLRGEHVTQALPVDTNSSMDGLSYDPSSVALTTSAGTVGNKDRQPIPKRRRGRPKTITDMKVYKAMKQREYRARKK